MSTKRIAILTLSIGWGHVRAAESLQRTLEAGNEPIEVQVLDGLEQARYWFHWLYVWPYWWMLRCAPGLWRRLFERRQRRLHRSTAPRWLFRRGCMKVLDRLRAFTPDLVIVTEIGAAEIAALGRREGWFNAPILAVQTDFQTEPPWVQPEIDAYGVGSEEARTQLIGWGVSPNRVLLCGIPVDPRFGLAQDKNELLQALGLDSRRPVVLVMGGGLGSAPLDRIIESLEFCRLPLQVLAVAGRNRELQQRLEDLKSKLVLDLHPLGWTENIPELMAVADLLITKPGGLTSAEALASQLPMLLTSPIPGPEERHVRYLEQRGAAVHAETLEEVPRRVSELFSSLERLREMRRQARELARPGAAFALAQAARALIDRGTYIDLLASPTGRSEESAYLM
jgi:processive 1,2-diacylglycerol beta-glucosyltransferase